MSFGCPFGCFLVAIYGVKKCTKQQPNATVFTRKRILRVDLVDPSGFEPLTSSMPLRRSTN